MAEIAALPRAIARSAVSTLAQQIAVALIQVLAFVLVARELGLQGNGTFAMIYTVSSVLALLLNMGQSAAIVYLVGSGEHPALVVLRAVRQLGSVFILCGFVLFFFGVMLVELLDLFPVSIEALLYVPVIFVLQIIFSFLLAFHQGCKQFKLYNLAQILQAMLNLIFIFVIIVLPLRSTVSAFLFAYVASTALACLFLMAQTRPEHVEIDVADVIRCKRRLLHYGLRAHTANAVNLVNYRADVLILGAYLGMAPVGAYVVAVRIAEQLWLPSRAISAVALPYLSSLEPGASNRLRLVARLAILAMAVVATLSVLIWFISEELLGALFGAEFLSALEPLWVLLIGVTVLSAGKVLANDIAARDHPGLNSLTVAIAAVFNIVLNLLLIPEYGIMGAAMATSVSYGVIVVLTVGFQTYLNRTVSE